MANETHAVDLSFRPCLESVSAVRRFLEVHYGHLACDAQLISRMAVTVHELLENAAKYSSGGGSRLRVEVDPAAPRAVSISVINRADPRNFVYSLPGPGDVDAGIFVTGTMGGGDRDPRVDAILDRLRPLPMCVIGPPEPGVPCIAIDNASGVRALTRHLIEKHDRRRIAFVTGHGREAEHRLAGFRAGHQDRGMTADDNLVIRGDFRFSAGLHAVATLLDGPARCDPIAAAHDWMALGALAALRARGVRVPEDIAVVGFDDVEEARFATPPLTTVRQAPRQLGIEAARVVLSQVRGGGAR